jgi:D-lactate dehydrogenase (cytochrome)
MKTEAYRELLEQCVHCGLCLEACPIYAIFGTEADAPRGRIALMRAVAEGKLGREDFLRTFGDHITLCLACRACESACPSGVEYGTLVQGAHIALEEAKSPGPVEGAVRWLGLHQLMPHVGQLKTMAQLMRLYEVSGLQRLVRTLNVLPNPLRAMEGILPPIPPNAARPDYSQPAPAIGEKRGTVAFFYGCIQEAFLGQINAATIRVLQRNGYEVHVPQSQTCCGAAQWHVGEETLAQDLARQNIDAFLAEDYDAVVNNAGGCGLTLQEYPELLADDPDYAERAEQFAAKVQDFSEFIYRHLHVPPEGELRVRATYSDSCHLRHGQDVVDEPRELLDTIPGLELVELQHPERCCGSAGIYNIMQPATATAVLDAKMEDIAATGANLVVTSNTGCHMQLVAGVRRAGLNAHVMHVAEVLDLAYEAADRREAVQRLEAPVRHPKPLFGRPEVPERWLAWQARRRPLMREDSELADLAADLEPGQVMDNPVELLTYEVDGGVDRAMPHGVVFPYATEDVQTIVRWAADRDVPIVARGAGTGLAGGAVAERGGLIVEFSHMREIVAFDTLGRSAVVQPGVVNLDLDLYVKTEGLYFPPDPASGRAATIGGNVGANAGGPHCFKYGVTTNYVTGLEVVLADGRVVSLGGRAQDYPAYDFVGLMTGSEGTLGVLTEASVRLLRNPPAVKTLMAAFPTVEAAGDAVSAMIARGLMPATMEMMDQKIMRIIEEYAHPGLPLDAGAVIIIDADGYPVSVDPQVAEIAAVLEQHGATELRVARDADERAKIWLARKSAAGSLARVAPDHYTVDGTVPRSRLAEALRETARICADLDLPVVYLLHAGDGNLHPMVLIPDPNDAAYLARVHEAGRRMAQLFVSMGGTITGEHGVGIEKRDFMPLMHSADELDAMREIKTLFDPHDLLNPDKVFPREGEEAREREGEDARAQSVVHEARVAPATAAEAAEVIRACAAAGRRLRIEGGGTKSDGAVEAEGVLSTEALCGIETHVEDLYVTVGAGTRLADLQAALAEHGMWVPLASPWEAATVGGILATNFNAPLRMRYGSLRDLALSLTAVLPDGRVIRAGRPVMKDVAGYDLAKLFIGAHGTLGLITDVSLRLYPQPRARVTRALPLDDVGPGLAQGAALLRDALVASSVLLCRGPILSGVDAAYTLLYTAEGLPEDVTAEMDAISGGVVSTVPGSAAWAAWMGTTEPQATLVRLGVPPKDLPGVVRDLAARHAAVPFVADLAAGLLYLRADADIVAPLRRAAQALGGYAVVLRSPEAAVDRWGHHPDAEDLMQALKDRWDPQGIINPGAFLF